MIAALAMAMAAATGGGPVTEQAPSAGETGVAMISRAFTPSRVTVLVGERVRWSNQDNAVHTVTADDRSFDSGRLEPGTQFARPFARPGSVQYKCSLHRFMRGSVEVVAISLTGPAGAVRHGSTAGLSGRTPQPGTPVTLERLGAGAVAQAVADDEGRFSFAVPAEVPTRYRARAGGETSAVVPVDVAPSVRLAARRGSSGAISVRVHVTPPQPRALLLLERHERERFGFVRLRRLRLDAHSRARLVLRTHRRLRLRARLARPVGGFARATSPVTVVTRHPRTGRQEDGHH